MGIEILEGTIGDHTHAVLVCTTGSEPFGPLLDDASHGERVLEACKRLGVDPRSLREVDLADLIYATSTIALSADSHLDHGLDPEQVICLLCYAAHDRETDTRGPNATTIVTATLPPELGAVECALYGPIMGDPPVTDAFFVRRGDRAGDSRMVRRPLREVREATIIVGPHDGRTVVYTAFGGPLAPREPWDPSLDEAGRAESEAFWSEHALALGD